jgi:hypothetical protein
MGINKRKILWGLNLLYFTIYIMIGSIIGILKILYLNQIVNKYTEQGVLDEQEQEIIDALLLSSLNKKIMFLRLFMLSMLFWLPILIISLKEYKKSI